MGIPETTNRMRNAPLQALRTMFTGIGRILMAADRPDRTAIPGRRGDDFSNGSGHSRPEPASAASRAQARWRSLDQTGNVRLLSAEDFEDGLDRRTRPTTAASGYARAPEADPWPSPSASDSPDIEAWDFRAPEATVSAAPGLGFPEPEHFISAALGPDFPTAEPPLSATPGLGFPNSEPSVSAAPGLGFPEPERPVSADSPVSAIPDSPVSAEPDYPVSPALPLAAYDSLSLPSIRARLRSLDPAQLRVLIAYEQAHAERPEVLGMFERRIEKLEARG
jgi:hypothetical protein